MLELNKQQAMETRKFHENDTYEFYDSRGTYSDAQEVQKTLKEKYGKNGTLQLDPVYGWIVRVNKQQEYGKTKTSGCGLRV